jgi:phosphoserine phosphatase RsbU/P
MASTDLKTQSSAMLQGENLRLRRAVDGINEAVNEDQQQYGYERLTDVVLASKNLSAAETINTIEASVRAHVRSELQSDDMTVLVIKRLPA